MPAFLLWLLVVCCQGRTASQPESADSPIAILKILAKLPVAQQEALLEVLGQSLQEQVGGPSAHYLVLLRLVMWLCMDQCHLCAASVSGVAHCCAPRRRDIVSSSTLPASSCGQTNLEES